MRERSAVLKWDYQNITYGIDERQRIDIAFPNNKQTHAIVYFHGGAYFSGNKSQYPSFLSDYAGKNVIASIDYRVINQDNNIHIGDILSDVDAALLKIIDFSRINGVNIKNFILIGHSAGGHIGLLYGYKTKKIKIAACISLAGPTDFTDDLGWSSRTMWGKNIEERLSFLSWMGSRLTKHQIKLERYDWTRQKNYSLFKNHIMAISPIIHVLKNKKIPPTFLVYACNDDQVPYSNAERLITLLKNTEKPSILITPSKKGDSHMLGGVIYSDDGPIFFDGQPWVAELKTWLEEYLE